MAASEEQLQLVLEATEQGVWDWRLDEDVVLHNRRWCDLLGLDASFARHPSAGFVERLHEDDRAAVLARVTACLEGKAPYRSEHRMRRLDGSVVWVEDRGMVVARSDDGRPLRMVGSITDVTERHEAEARLARFFSVSLDLLCIADFEGKLLRVNRAWEDVLGYATHELEGRRFLDFVHPDDLAATLGAVATLEDGKPLPTFENRYRARDGSYRWLSWRSHPAEGLIHAAARDVTEARRTREALVEAKERAEAANLAKSSFLANMSHEIRTPMNGVLGMAELLLGTRLDAEQEEWARTIVASAESLLTILNDILDFSRIESGKLAVEEIRFDLPSLVYDAVEPLRARVAGSDVELAVRVDPDLPRFHVGDPGRVRQILLNLVGNAVKFTSRGHILVELAAEHGTLVLRVTDTGIGIPLARQTALFQPFEQVDASTSRRYGGSGLGLAIARRLAGLMGGVVTLDSEPGVGSSFTVSLPLRPAPDQAGGEPTRGLGLRGLSVLVVDDLAVNRRILREQLEARGAHVLEAEDAEGALGRLAERHVDLAVVDVRMPVTDGFALARRALASRPGLRVVALTSSGLRGEAEAARAAGCHGYLVKPCPGPLLAGVLKAVASGHAGLVTRHTLREQAARTPVARAPERPLRGVRVLVAEDNRVNQRVARLLLERQGAVVRVVDDGAAALEAIEAARPDVVLMDLQMPGMDGIEATAALRSRESATRAPRLPVVALTANTMAGDRERCLAAGMDAYVPKPLRAEELVATVLELLTPSLPDRASGPPSSEAAGEAEVVFDEGVLAELRTLGDEELRELFATWRADLPGQREALAACLAAGDAKGAARAAHTMKGGAAALGLVTVAKAAAAIEDACRNGKTPDEATLDGAVGRATARVDEVVGTTSRAA